MFILFFGGKGVNIFVLLEYLKYYIRSWKRDIKYFLYKNFIFIWIRVIKLNRVIF